ncbi:MAG: hypothetical protein R2716_02075 [Microthrixaceae bacterium]
MAEIGGETQVDVPAAVARRPGLAQVVPFAERIEPEVAALACTRRERVEDLPHNLDVPPVGAGEPKADQVVDHLGDLIDPRSAPDVPRLAQLSPEPRFGLDAAHGTPDAGQITIGEVVPKQAAHAELRLLQRWLEDRGAVDVVPAAESGVVERWSSTPHTLTCIDHQPTLTGSRTSPSRARAALGEPAGDVVASCCNGTA